MEPVHTAVKTLSCIQLGAVCMKAGRAAPVIHFIDEKTELNITKLTNETRISQEDVSENGI